jgi:hypothetical protein
MLLGCLPQVSPILPATVADAARQGKMGMLRLKVGPFHAMRTAAADLQRVNRVKLTVLSADKSFRTEEIVSLNLSSSEAQIAVPFGRNFIVFAQGMNDDIDVVGARVGGYFDITDGNPVNIAVTQKTTPVADIVRYLMVKDPQLAQVIDLPSLQLLVDQAAVSTSPAMINPQAFGDAIVASKGLPVKEPGTARFQPGRISGTVTGLDPDEVAIITCNDPASRPYILVGGTSSATGGTSSSSSSGDGESDNFRIDNVQPGTWTVRIVASNAGADPVDLVRTVTVGTPYVAPPLDPKASASATAAPTIAPSASPSGDGFTGPTAEVEFELRASAWATAAINATSNVGISDQPDAAIDGADNIHLVWRQDYNPALQDSDYDDTYGFDKNISGAIYYSRWNGQSWSRDNQNISVIEKQGAREPAIAVGIDRLPAVVWSGLNGSLREIRFSRFDGQSWSAPVSISSGIDSTYSAVSPDIAVDKINGHIYVVWQGGDGPYTYFREWYGTGWTPAKRVSSQGGFRPKITTAYDGSVHIAWISPTIDKNGQHGETVRYARYFQNSWEAGIDLPIMMTEVVDHPWRKRLDIAADRQNRIHLIAHTDTALRYFFGSAGVWTDVERVDDDVATTDVGAAACLHVDPVGNIRSCIIGAARTKGGVARSLCRPVKRISGPI